MRAFKTIRDPEAFDILGDETRRKIIYMLRVKEMTVSQLAGELHVTTQAIYHQIGKLLKAELVEVAREERVDHFIETYYRATAEVFELHFVGGERMESAKYFKEAFEAFPKLGLAVNADEKVIAKVAELHEGMEKLGLSSDLEEKISQLDDVPFFAKSKVYELDHLAIITDKQVEKLIEYQKALRKLMTSSITKRAEKTEQGRQ